MADPASSLDPAVAMLELDSIALGVVTGDAMIKASPLGSIYAGTVHPGRYLVLVSGDTASVEVALEVGRATGGGSVVDSMFLPDVHPEVSAAIVATDDTAAAAGEAIGLIETATVATVIEAADAGVKSADVTLAALRLADGLGGKGYLVFGGVLADVEAAVESAVARAEPSGHLLHHVVVAQLADEMRHNLTSDLRFSRRVAARPQERQG
jgi:microcompartment protein CcmL/EutN